MYKIITDISIVENLNDIARNREKKKDGSIDMSIKYCDAIKHPIRDEWIIPIDENLLRIYNPENLDYLLSDNFETIPEDWNWLYDEPIRITIPNYLILTDPNLKELIHYCEDYDILTYTNETHTYVYVYYIMEVHRTLFGMFEQITIENRS
jgi:hypothetical protein